MRFATAVALAAVMLWVPVDGVAQDLTLSSNELANLLYEGRICRRGTAFLDTADLSIFDGDSKAYLESQKNWLNCDYILEPFLYFRIENVGPNATLRILKVLPGNPYNPSIEIPATRCLTMMNAPAGFFVHVSMVTGEIYPYESSDDDYLNFCRG